MSPRYRLSSVAAIFLLILAGAACSDKDSAKLAQGVDPYNKGVTESDAGQWTEAAASFNEAIRADPKDADAHFKLAVAYQQLKRYPEAVKEYEEAIRYNPRDGEANLRLGGLQNDLGKSAEAIAPLKQAMILLPDNAEPFDELGLSYLVLKQYPEAAAAYLQSIKLQPANAVARYRIGWSYTAVARYTEAIESFNEAVRLKPDYVEAFSERGYAYRGLQRNEEAAASYQRAIAIDPKFVPAHHGLSLSYQALGNAAAAKEQQDILRALDPDWATKSWPSPAPPSTSSTGGASGATTGAAAPTIARATISGEVTTKDTTPLRDVRVLLSGTVNAETRTDASGNYAFDNLVMGDSASYEVRPVLSDSDFNPPLRVFSGIRENQTASIFIARGGAADAVVGAQSGRNYELIPNPDLNGQTGQLVFSFADKDAVGGAAISPGNQFVFLNNKVPLAPGAYDITVNGALLVGVPVQLGMNTSVKIGVLKLSVAADIYDQTKTKELSFVTGGKVALPVGTYNLKIDGGFKPVLIRDMQVTEI